MRKKMDSDTPMPDFDHHQASEGSANQQEASHEEDEAISFEQHPPKPDTRAAPIENHQEPEQEFDSSSEIDDDSLNVPENNRHHDENVDNPSYVSVPATRVAQQQASGAEHALEALSYQYSNVQPLYFDPAMPLSMTSTPAVQGIISQSVPQHKGSWGKLTSYVPSLPAFTRRNVSSSSTAAPSLEKKRKQSQKRPAQSEQALEQLRTTYEEELERAKKEYNKALLRSQSEYRSLEGRYKLVEGRMQQLEQSSRRLQGNNNVLENQLRLALAAQDEAYEDKKQAMMKVQQVQERAFTLFGEAEWQPEEDGDIARDLSLLEKSCKQWSQSHSYPRFCDCPCKNTDDEARARFLSACGYFCKVSSSSLPGGLEGDTLDKKAPSLLLTSWLLDFAYRKIIANPFFFLNDRQDSLLRSTDTNGAVATANVAEHLHTLINEMEKCKAAESYAWRANLLRQLLPRDSTIEKNRPNPRVDSLADTKALSNQAITSTCQKLAREFQIAAAVLIPAREDSADTALVKILAKAARISTSLWTQKRQYALLPLYSLPKSFGENMKMAEAHPLHNAIMEDAPGDLYGKPILMVTQPALLAYGNSEGTDYNISRVIKKATVWMGQ